MAQVSCVECTVSKFHQMVLQLVPMLLGFESKKMGFLGGLLDTYCCQGIFQTERKEGE